MFLSEVPIADVVSSLNGKVRFVGLKAPMNFNLEGFERKLKNIAERRYIKEFKISNNKKTYWTYTVYEFKEKSCMFRKENVVYS